MKFGARNREGEVDLGSPAALSAGVRSASGAAEKIDDLRGIPSFPDHQCQ